MDSELTQVERHERAVGARTHAEGSARVQHEQGGTSWSDPTENLDLAHRVVAPEPRQKPMRQKKPAFAGFFYSGGRI